MAKIGSGVHTTNHGLGTIQRLKTQKIDVDLSKARMLPKAAKSDKRSHALAAVISAYEFENGSPCSSYSMK